MRRQMIIETTEMKTQWDSFWFFMLLKIAMEAS
jgi:hypothetical protein